MPTTYQKNKQHIYKWRQDNYEKMKSINRKSAHKYYVWKKVSVIYLNILIEV